MAARYWVGGTGTWDAVNTTNWSATSGGAGGASVPTAVDNAFFDAASGGGIATLGQDVPCIQLDIRGYTGTLDFSTFVVNSEGSAVISPRQDGTATVIGTKTVNLNYSGAVGTRTISLTTAVTEANALNVNVTAGTDTITTNAACVLRNLNFTGFAGTYANTTRTIYGNLTISSGMTVTAGTNATTFAATSGTQQITTNGKTLDFPITQNNPGATLQLQDNLTMGSTRTFNLTAGTLDLVDKTLSTGLFNTSNSNVRTLAFGTGQIELTGNSATIWNGSTSTNLTVTGSKTINCTYSGATGTRILNTSAALSETNAYNVNVTAGTDIVSLQNRYYNLNTTGFTGTIAATSRTIFGSLTIGAGATYTSTTTTTTFAGTSGSHTITTNGVLFDGAITFNGPSGSWVFTDALTQESTRNFTITAGTVALKNGVTSTVGNFIATSSDIKFLQSSLAGSQATLSQASGTVNVVDLTIRDINAVGGASWNAYTDFENTDAGNNDGWNFSLSPPYSVAELPVTLRPFTQPRRF
jgi:hypothetical protein